MGNLVYVNGPISLNLWGKECWNGKLTVDYFDIDRCLWIRAHIKKLLIVLYRRQHHLLSSVQNKLFYQERSFSWLLGSSFSPPASLRFSVYSCPFFFFDRYSWESCLSSVWSSVAANLWQNCSQVRIQNICFMSRVKEFWTEVQKKYKTEQKITSACFRCFFISLLTHMHSS